MKDEKSKLLKIMNELVWFFLKSGNHHVDIQLDLHEHEGVIVVEGCCKNISDKQIQELASIINSPRKDEAEEYYWNLIGSNNFSEMHLLGALVNDGEVGYVGDNLRIKVRRKF